MPFKLFSLLIGKNGSTLFSLIVAPFKTWTPLRYKTFFMLNSIQHEISIAHKN